VSFTEGDPLVQEADTFIDQIIASARAVNDLPDAAISMAVDTGVESLLDLSAAQVAVYLVRAIQRLAEVTR
jgi:hypothetical protein